MTQTDAFSYFDGCVIPNVWKYLGANHTRDTDDDGDEYVVTYGLVFDDLAKQLKIRFCYLVASERYVIVERDRKYKYRTACNFKKNELEQLNEFVIKNYIDN